VVDFAFLHSHGVMLLFFSAPLRTDSARARWTSTPIKTCRRILARRGGKSPRMRWSSPCGANAPSGAKSTLWGSRGVRMPERATGGDAVADELFDLLDLRKAAALLARPDDLVIDAHLEDATGPIRGERHGAELLGERGQQLLRHPARPQAPAAQSAIGDLDHGADGHSSPPRAVRGCAGINQEQR